MKILTTFLSGIDRVSRWSGKITRWLVYPLIGALCYEVIARYVFNAPTKWAYDITYMLYGALFMMGAAYTLLVDGHVRVDALRTGLSPKTKAILEIVCYLIFFFPVIGILVYLGTGFAERSWALAEQAKESMWAPPIYPFKAILPVAMFLLLIQGIAQFTRHLVFITTGRQL